MVFYDLTVRSIRNVFAKNKIINYRIIKHEIRQQLSLSTEKNNVNKNSDRQLYIVLFTYKYGTAQLSLPVCESHVIEEIITKYINNHYYITSLTLDLNTVVPRKMFMNDINILEDFTCFTDSVHKEKSELMGIPELILNGYSHEKTIRVSSFYTAGRTQPYQQFKKYEYVIANITNSTGQQVEHIFNSTISKAKLMNVIRKKHSSRDAENSEANTPFGVFFT